MGWPVGLEVWNGCVGEARGRVAAAFGRDRSTVAHACREIEDRREDGQFDLWISALEGMLHRAPFAAVSAEKVRR